MLQALDHSIADYLKFRSYDAAAEALRVDAAADASRSSRRRRGPGSPSKPSANVRARRKLLKAFDSGGGAAMFEVWASHVGSRPSKVPSVTRAEAQAAADAVEVDLRVHAATWGFRDAALARYAGEGRGGAAAAAGAAGKAMAGFRRWLDTPRGRALTAQAPHLPCCALPFVSNPSDHPTFAPVFAREWLAACRARLRLHLDTVGLADPQEDAAEEAASADPLAALLAGGRAKPPLLKAFEAASLADTKMSAGSAAAGTGGYSIGSGPGTLSDAQKLRVMRRREGKLTRLAQSTLRTAGKLLDAADTAHATPEVATAVDDARRQLSTFDAVLRGVTKESRAWQQAGGGGSSSASTLGGGSSSASGSNSNSALLVPGGAAAGAHAGFAARVLPPARCTLLAPLDLRGVARDARRLAAAVGAKGGGSKGGGGGGGGGSKPPGDAAAALCALLQALWLRLRAGSAARRAYVRHDLLGCGAYVVRDAGDAPPLADVLLSLHARRAGGPAAAPLLAAAHAAKLVAALAGARSGRRYLLRCPPIVQRLAAASGAARATLVATSDPEGAAAAGLLLTESLRALAHLSASGTARRLLETARIPAWVAVVVRDAAGGEPWLAHAASLLARLCADAAVREDVLATAPKLPEAAADAAGNAASAAQGEAFARLASALARRDATAASSLEGSADGSVEVIHLERDGGADDSDAERDGGADSDADDGWRREPGAEAVPRPVLTWCKAHNHPTGELLLCSRYLLCDNDAVHREALAGEVGGGGKAGPKAAAPAGEEPPQTFGIRVTHASALQTSAIEAEGESGGGGGVPVPAAVPALDLAAEAAALPAEFVSRPRLAHTPRGSEAGSSPRTTARSSPRPVPEAAVAQAPEFIAKPRIARTPLAPPGSNATEDDGFFPPVEQPYRHHGGPHGGHHGEKKKRRKPRAGGRNELQQLPAHGGAGSAGAGGRKQGGTRRNKHSKPLRVAA